MGTGTEKLQARGAIRGADCTQHRRTGILPVSTIPFTKLKSCKNPRSQTKSNYIKRGGWASPDFVDSVIKPLESKR
jgi:hypothetical protein